jgi:hypothetical protein
MLFAVVRKTIGFSKKFNQIAVWGAQLLNFTT